MKGRAMLKGISPLLSPALLAALCEMGHGDEIVLADAHFPAATLGRRVIRADGLAIADLLAAILPLFELDRAPDPPVTMMAAAAGDELDPAIEAAYFGVLRRHAPELGPPARIERFEFYERTRQALAVVATGDTAKYGNVMLRKGVTPLP
jgi:L-fucose mutarotase